MSLAAQISPDLHRMATRLSRRYSGYGVYGPDDAYQEAMLGLIEHPASSNQLAWLTMRSAIIDGLRHVMGKNRSQGWRMQRLTSAMAEGIDDPMDAIDRADQRADAPIFLSRIRPKDRELIERHVCDGETLKELGCEAGVTPSAISLRLQRALSELRRRADA